MDALGTVLITCGCTRDCPQLVDALECPQNHTQLVNALGTVLRITHNMEVVRVSASRLLSPFHYIRIIHLSISQLHTVVVVVFICTDLLVLLALSCLRFPKRQPSNDFS